MERQEEVLKQKDAVVEEKGVVCDRRGHRRGHRREDQLKRMRMRMA